MIEDLIRTDDARPRNITGSGIAGSLGSGLLGNFMSLEQIIQQISENDPK